VDGPDDEDRTQHEPPYPGPPVPEPPLEPPVIRFLRNLNLGWTLLQPVLLGAITVAFLTMLPFVEALREPYVLGPSGVVISLLAAAGIKRG
jgi:hypothetical protein